MAPKNYKQIDCFSKNMAFWKFLGLWPGEDIFKHYILYSRIFNAAFIFLSISLATINFYFLPNDLNMFVDELLFYITEIAVLSKIMTFWMMKNNINNILDMLECELFQGANEEEYEIIDKAKKFNKKYWKIIAIISYTSNLVHISMPVILHFALKVKLNLVLCSYSFLSDDFKQKFIYPLYIYQAVAIHFQMLVNVNVDTLILGSMILAIAQLEILNRKLRMIADKEDGEIDDDLVKKLNACVVHYQEIIKYCDLIQGVFSGTFFVQFGGASANICVCLFKFTLPAPMEFYIFLGTYMCVVIFQILVPCWFGTQIIDKSQYLSQAIYDSDWTPTSRRFRSSLRFFVERANTPLSITGGKMFPISLSTFTSIMNSAYSFFTLLRHMQSRDS